MSNSHDKFSQLPTDHVIRHKDILIRLAVVYSEAQPHEIWQDGRGAGSSEDGGLARTRGDVFWESDGEEVGSCGFAKGRERLAGEVLGALRKGRREDYGDIEFERKEERGRCVVVRLCSIMLWAGRDMG